MGSRAYWAVVDEGNIHHGLEDAVLHAARIVLLHSLVEVFVQVFGDVSWGRLVEVRLVPLSSRSEQGELRDWNRGQIRGSSCRREAKRTAEDFTFDIDDTLLPLRILHSTA